MDKKNIEVLHENMKISAVGLPKLNGDDPVNDVTYLYAH